VVIWEMTQACDLACIHCRAEAQPDRHPDEFSTEEAKALFRQIADLRPGVLVLSGGDPMKRNDVFKLIRYGCELGIRMAMTPSVTPLLTDGAITKLAESGLSQMAVSLDGSHAAVHDGFRGVPGAFQRTLEVIRHGASIGLPIQINTTITRTNLDDLPAIAALVENLDIVLWSVFFLVPVGRGQADQCISGEEYEQVFERLYRLSKRANFKIKTTEAPHYRRFVLQSLKAESASREERQKYMQSMIGLNDGKGFVFISHTGDVFPSGFMPTPAGNVREQSLSDLYQKSPVFTELRQPDRLEGKCGLCEFNQLCGGSRARAYALTGNPLASESECLYVPSTMPHVPTK